MPWLLEEDEPVTGSWLLESGTEPWLLEIEDRRILTLDEIKQDLNLDDDEHDETLTSWERRVRDFLEKELDWHIAGVTSKTEFHRGGTDTFYVCQPPTTSDIGVFTSDVFEEDVFVTGNVIEVDVRRSIREEYEPLLDDDGAPLYEVENRRVTRIDGRVFPEGRSIRARMIVGWARPQIPQTIRMIASEILTSLWRSRVTATPSVGFEKSLTDRQAGTQLSLTTTQKAALNNLRGKLWLGVGIR